MTLEMPSVESITSKLAAGAAAESTVVETPPAALANEQPAVAATVDEAAAQAAAEATSTSTASAPTTEPSASPDLKAAIESTVTTGGIAALVDAIPLAAREELGRVLKPGMDKALNRKDSEIGQLREQLITVTKSLTKSITEEVTELLTAGMSDAEKQQIREGQAARQKARDTEASTAEQTQRINAALERAWSIVEEEGLPRDRTDPRVLALDWARDERDPEKAMERLRASARAIKAGKPATTSAATAGKAPLTEAEIERVVTERAQAALDKLLIKRGLKADTGRPGAGAGAGAPAAPKTMAEALARSRERLASSDRI